MMREDNVPLTFEPLKAVQRNNHKLHSCLAHKLSVLFCETVKQENRPVII